MTTQWSTRGIDSANQPPGIDPSVLEESVVLLMQGKNTFGDRIYSYLKLTLKDMARMQEASQSGQPFSPSDFGTVVAAGQGEPTAEIRQEVEATYKVLGGPSQQAAAPASAPTETKSWDEF